MQLRDRLIVALDRSSRDEILRLADALRGVSGGLKIGLQAFVANGPDLVRELVGRGEKVFLDLKIHDIPNTAQNAVAEAAALGVAMTTVHASGGAAMLRACAAAVRDGNAVTSTSTPVKGPAPLLVLGVTVLTSLDAGELQRIGLHESAIDHAVRLARLSKECGLLGLVVSPEEIVAVREACGQGMAIVVPGVRPDGSAAGDQRRTKTPAAAIAAGADYIVVGRPVTDAPNPRAAASAILESISR